ncbi:hypothetical protein Tco_1287624, partial [Tanacetum coccineum]
VRTSLDSQTEEEFDETQDYLLDEDVRMQFEEEERLLLEEERLIEDEKRVRLEEQKRLIIEEERVLEVKKSAIDNIWISEDLDIYLGQPGHLRCKFPWSTEVCVDRRLWESLVCLDPPRQGWLMDEAMVSIYFVQLLLQNRMPLWFLFILMNLDNIGVLLNFDILSGVVTFYDSGDSYDVKCHDGYIRTRDCLQVVVYPTHVVKLLAGHEEFPTFLDPEENTPTLHIYL